MTSALLLVAAQVLWSEWMPVAGVRAWRPGPAADLRALVLGESVRGLYLLALLTRKPVPALNLRVLLLRERARAVGPRGLLMLERARMVALLPSSRGRTLAVGLLGVMKRCADWRVAAHPPQCLLRAR